MNNNELSEEIIREIGGAANIRTLTHCATRLRMEFNQRHRVNQTAIEQLPGVISVVDRGGSFRL